MRMYVFYLLTLIPGTELARCQTIPVDTLNFDSSKMNVTLAMDRSTYFPGEVAEISIEVSCPLSWEVESYDGASGKLTAWLKVPWVSRTIDKTVYMAYGNPAMTTFQSNAGSLWSQYALVSHFPEGSSVNLSDSSPGAVTGAGHNAPSAAAGKIGGGLGLVNSNSQYVDYPLGTSAGAITLSAWVKAGSFPNAYNAIVTRSASLQGYAQLFVTGAGRLAAYVKCADSIAPSVDPGAATLVPGSWYHVVAAYDSVQGLVTYVNGVLDGTSGARGTLSSNTAVVAAGNDTLTPGRFFNGAIDEVRVMYSARSADWIAAEYNNQNSPATFSSLGAEVPLP